jgi:hypothetical protein
MGQAQYYGLAKNPNYGLDYESMIKSLARLLPESYAAKQTAANQTAQKDYYTDMVDIGNKENELTAEQIALNESQIKAAQKNQTIQTGLGLASTGVGLYGIYKNAQLADKIAGAAINAGSNVINSEPGIISTAWNGAKGLATDAYNAVFGASTPTVASGGAGLSGVSGGTGMVDMSAGWGAAEAGTELASSTLPTLESGSSLLATEATPVVADAVGTGVGSTISGVVSKVAVPLAIIGAANMARDKWGGTNKDYREKSAKERFFDDPGMGLGANVMGAIFGDKSEMARIPMQVGEQFSHYAGGPISKAFKGDFAGGVHELVNAPQTTLESFGVDKKTAEAVNYVLNPGKVVKKIWDSIF